MNELSSEAIRFYCGLGEMHYNHHPTFTGPYACVSPIYGGKKKRVNRVSVPLGTLVLQDSGAFSDAVMVESAVLGQSTLLQTHRLTPEAALRRQEEHAKLFGYEDQIEARASNDVLIDEWWWYNDTGNLLRSKRRWTENDAELAVEETVKAAAYLNAHRNGISCVMSAQGVTVNQYIRCTERIMPFLRDGDIFGLGGFCILGRVPSLLPMFYETVQRLIPFLGREGIRRVHIWGSCFVPALGPLLYLCDAYGLQLSTDSVGPSTRPVKKDPKTGFAEWGFGSWHNNRYPVPPVLASCKTKDSEGHKAPICPPTSPCRGLERARHIRETREWLADFRKR